MIASIETQIQLGHNQKHHQLNINLYKYQTKFILMGYL